MLLLLVIATRANVANASHVPTIEIVKNKNVSLGDFIRLVWDAESKSQTSTIVLINKTRAKIFPSEKADRMIVQLPCISVADAVKLREAVKMGTIRAELVEKGEKLPEPKTDILNSAGITNGWCSTPQSGATQP